MNQQIWRSTKFSIKKIIKIKQRATIHKPTDMDQKDQEITQKFQVKKLQRSKPKQKIY